MRRSFPYAAAHTNLAGANLRGAVLDYADFAGADLSQADLLRRAAAQCAEPLDAAARRDPSATRQRSCRRICGLRAVVLWSETSRLSPSSTPPNFGRTCARDLRRRTFYGQTMRFAGVLLVGAVATTGLVTETAHDTLPAGTGEAQKSVEPTLSVLPAMEAQASSSACRPR